MFTQLEMITTNYKEMQCKNIRMVTRRVYSIKKYDYSMYQSSYALKARMAVESIFLSFNKPLVVNNVQCTNGYTYMEEFEIKYK